MLDIGGRKLWFWDIIDEHTRFLLASHISRTRTTKDARKLVHAARKRAGGKIPKVIITDGLRAYQDGIELEFGGDTHHIQSKPFTETDTTNHIERFHGSLKDRTKVMRGLKDAKSARLILDGWLLHYNFLRKHETLGKTPAEAAGVRYPYHNWQDIVAGQKVITPRQTSATSTIPISKIPSFSNRAKRGHLGRRQARNSRRLTPSVIAGRV
jgi:transposase InsO family protein